MIDLSNLITLTFIVTIGSTVYCIWKIVKMKNAGKKITKLLVVTTILPESIVIFDAVKRFWHWLNYEQKLFCFHNGTNECDLCE